MTQLSLTIAPELPSDRPLIRALHERAFGPGRFARTASRLREGANPDPALCFTARVGTLLVGSIRLTPLRIGGERGLLLGPVAVEPAFEGRGIGRQLIERSLGAAEGCGYAMVVLVGDEPYYGRLGFKRLPPGRIAMPGPVDPARLLYRALDPAVLERIAPGAEVRPGAA